ncbi:MAG TPA: DMT family transporter [Bacteroidia bacterium]|nr:DMT family transporter [Bacteroidia bacterium]
MSVKKAYVQMHTAIFLWGFTGILGKLITLNEGLLVWYRLIISGLIMWFVAGSKNKIRELTRKEILKIGGVGVIVMIHWVTFYGAIKISNVSVTLICLSSIALFTSVFEPIITKTKFDYIEIFFAALAMAGIYTIYHADNSMAVGILVAVFSSAASALFSVLNKQLTSKYNSYTISTVELSGAFISLSLFLPFYLPMFNHTFTFPDFTDIIYLFLLSFFCTVIPWILSLNALTHVTAFTQNLALNLEPVYGIILAIVVVKEYALLNTGFYIGAFIILMTVLLHTFYRYRKSNF